MTVSNAFSRPDQLSEELRVRILDAAERLGYVGPDPAARGLARGSVGAVGLLTASLRHTFSDEISTRFLGAIARELAPTGLALTLLPTAEPADAAPAWDVAVDGGIVYSCPPGSRSIERLRRRGVPLVHVDQPPDDDALAVNVDDRAGARAAAQHLLDFGHRRIGIVTVGLGDRAGVEARPPAELVATTAAHAPRQRLLGWLDALDAAGVRPVVARQPDNYVDTHLGARALLDASDPAASVDSVSGPASATGAVPGPRPTAVLCFSDAIAEGTLREARARGLRVPQDLSVVGFDDNGLAGWTDPPLTTVRQDVDAKGRAAVGALLDAIAARRVRAPGSPPVRPDGPPRRVVLPTQLVARGSTGPAPHA
ncbi:MAG: LacI family DNA-binding transcriptional regulator [Actinotalea sp.]|nr:LacI family DNA-binding transcriptional regulator [Actinotalea sp.]